MTKKTAAQISGHQPELLDLFFYQEMANVASPPPLPGSLPGTTVIFNQGGGWVWELTLLSKWVGGRDRNPSTDTISVGRNSSPETATTTKSEQPVVVQESVPALRLVSPMEGVVDRKKNKRGRPLGAKNKLPTKKMRKMLEAVNASDRAKDTNTNAQGPGLVSAVVSSEEEDALTPPLIPEPESKAATTSPPLQAFASDPLIAPPVLSLLTPSVVAPPLSVPSPQQPVPIPDQTVGATVPGSVILPHPLKPTRGPLSSSVHSIVTTSPQPLVVSSNRLSATRSHKVVHRPSPKAQYPNNKKAAVRRVLFD